MKGKARAARALPPARAARPLRRGRHPHPRRPARRPRAREAAADRHLRALRAAALLPAGDDRGRAGGGQEPALRRALRLPRRPPGLVRWRQGRCLPYGEGIAFWALGEIVKAECGILESDSPEEAEAKLEQRLPAGGSRPALAQGPPGSARGRRRRSPPRRRSRSPLGAACSRRGRRTRETVLVFEDLHWADEALLSFLEHLADWAEGVPLLVLCTARPELYEQHPTLRRGRSQLAADQPRPAHGRGDGPPDCLAARAGGAAGGDAAGAARARGRQPALRGGVRAPARRPRRARPGEGRRCPTRCRR